MGRTASDSGNSVSRGDRSDRDTIKVYLVGGGIGSLAAAAFLIRDGDLPGRNITVLEELDRLGGSLDGSGSAQTGYVIRGGRMFERKYVCTFDLFSTIPTLDGSPTVTLEIEEFSQLIKTSSSSRLFRDGHRVDAPRFGLSERHILNLERLAIEPEVLLGRSSIAEQFEPSFFATDFWFMWCTTFAFQAWHSAVELKRYLARFAHMVSGFNRLEGVMRTVYNQYDSLIRPLRKWLEAHGVRFELNTRVTDLEISEDHGKTRVDRIAFEHEGRPGAIAVGASDLVLVTLGSMTEASSLGSMDAAPELKGKSDGGAWTLWERLAAGRPQFGRPSVFADHIDESKWISFTTTQYDPTFFRIVRDATGNAPGEGGLVSFTDSRWLLSIVLPHQPHFIGQPEDVNVFWGYGLFVDEPGDFVPKPMSACTGREVMQEVLGHLRIDSEADRILRTSICIPCMMPFITSQFLCRERGDRPQAIPEGSINLALIGQFCELPDDTVFTVEYSVRSAQSAVYQLLGLDRKPPAVYKGAHDPRVLYRAFIALHDLGG
jgi:oleate hydratase